MLRGIRKYINTHIVLIVLNAAFVIFASSLYMYDRIQVRSSIVNLEQTITIEKNARVCGEATTRLITKLTAMKMGHTISNVQISFDILASYEVALDLSLKRDIRCIMMEEMGDSMMRAYKAGVKDGAKNSNIGGV
jgi:hypothetical protein